jgi:hypothetical protein
VRLQQRDACALVEHGERVEPLRVEEVGRVPEPPGAPLDPLLADRQEHLRAMSALIQS